MASEICMLKPGENIVLIGMPGCGKSTLGVVLAKTLGYDFLDTDLVISSLQRNTLQKILDEQGLERFLQYEEQAGLSVNCERTVIATGGSMVFSEAAMEHLRANGRVVYLNVPPEELAIRLTNIRTRGIAASPGKSIADIYRERVPLYERYADLIVEVRNQQSFEDVVEALAAALTAQNA